MAYDPEHRLVLDVEVGKRGGPRIVRLLERVRRRLGGRPPRLVTSDAYATYATVLRRVWPQPPAPVPDRRCTRRARHQLPPAMPKPAPTLNYATVCKHRRAGRVVSVRTKAVFGTTASVAAAVRASGVSRTVNTSFLERHNATDRHRNARKARKTYRFSKDRPTHEAVGSFCTFTYNFCWPVRTLTQRRKRRPARPRTPAMAAGLADHVWTLRQWLAHPVAGLSG